MDNNNTWNRLYGLGVFVRCVLCVRTFAVALENAVVDAAGGS